MKLKPSKGLIGILSAVVVLIILGTGGVLWAQQQVLTGVRSALKQRQESLQDGQRMARRQEAAREALATDEQRLRFLEASVSNEAYVPTLLKQIEDLAKRTQNSVIGVRPQAASKKPTKLQQRRDPEAQAKAKEGDGDGEGEEKEEKPEPYTPLEIQVNLIGTFKSAQLFIEQLERFPKIIAVEQVELRPHNETGPLAATTSNRLEVNLKVTAFVMKEQARQEAEPVSAASVSAGAQVAQAQPLPAVSEGARP
jgi:Tfp pilus assembly protein PilO